MLQGYRALLAAAFTGMLTALAASSAHATVIDFTISDLGTTEATGSFSYTSAAPIVSYGDLTAFSLTIGAANYGLAFVQGSANYDYFQFDTVAKAFVPGDSNGSFGPLGPFLLSAFASDFSSGFDFFAAPRNNFSEVTQSLFDHPYDTVTVTGAGTGTGSVPEPTSLALLGGGLGLLGLFRLLRRRRTVLA